jgi:hypothetical protein
MKVARDSFLTSGLRSGRWRRGSWLLEVQIAFVMLGIGLAGLCPVVAMQLRQLVNLESRFMATSYTFNSVGGGPTRNRLGHFRLIIRPHPIAHRTGLHPQVHLTTTISFPGTTPGRKN